MTNDTTNKSSTTSSSTNTSSSSTTTTTNTSDATHERINSVDIPIGDELFDKLTSIFSIAQVR